MEHEYLVSNETGYLDVVESLSRTTKPGSVYIGVGPDQNYTYIAATGAEFSFIIDQRAENQYLHFLFKAIFELASNRVSYLQLLFSRPLGIEIGKRSSLSQIVALIDRTDGCELLYRTNLSNIVELIQIYQKAVPVLEIERIKEIYRNFFERSLDLTSRILSTTSHGTSYPTYREFLLRSRPTASNFLDNDEYFQYVKAKHLKNQIVPITGDLSGDKTLSALSDFCRSRDLLVDTVYISNVDYRLVNANLLELLVRNLELLPRTKDCLLVRSFYNRVGNIHPIARKDELFTTLLQRVDSFIDLSRLGEYEDYWAVGTRDYFR